MFSAITVYAVPPEACFADFRWDDCGAPPQSVMYYWKPGSRCEVGVWRGCTPNLNMFHDEYECINTCVFVNRAQPRDFHDILKLPDDIEMADPSESTDQMNVTTAITDNESTILPTDENTVSGNETIGITTDENTIVNTDSNTNMNTDATAAETTNTTNAAQSNVENQPKEAPKS
ncbi:hypothetical protein evm_009692 [Chilo suppressalis]|nr:hypothetical protein evm_009692 [Chilo suppressalis]